MNQEHPEGASGLKRVFDQWHWMPAAVLAMGIASIGLLIASDRIHEELVARDLAMVCAVSDLQTQAATAHLWIKEFVSGDEANHDRIWERLDGATAVSDALLGGGTVHQVTVQAITEPALRAQAEEIRAQIVRLRDITEEREALYRQGESVGIGSDMDMLHDDLYFALTDMSEALERQIVMRVMENKSQAQLLFRTILIAWVLIVAMAVTGLWSREHRRRQAEAALRESESQLLQAQKMEAVGRLAGGIAHDINNYLAAITAQSELVRMKSEPGSRVATKMDSVIATAQKASTLIKRLLAFSRRQPVQPEVVKLNRVVEGLGKMMTRLIGEDVELETALERSIWNVRIDPSQLEQVIVNLLVNAREAMPTGGRLMLTTRNYRLGQAWEEAPVNLPPGEYVMLSIADSGTGIPPEIRDKIFEPFFTTKEEAGRSGLGLATVYGIVRQNGGHITVRSQVGEGTEFRILVPRCTEPETRPVTSAVRAEPPARGHQERILLVEDSDDLRDSTRGLLEEMGYRVDVAANGEEALRLYDTLGDSLDLLITDVVMPGMSGREVMDHIRQRNRELNVLFISGYTDSVVVRHGVRDGEFEFLQKPFSAESLARKVRDVLEDRPPKTPKSATG